MRFIVSGKIVSIDQPFEIGDVSYPPGWLRTQEGRDAVGAVEIVEAPRPDERFFFVNEDPDNPGQWIATPRDLDEVKATKIAAIKAAAQDIIYQNVPAWKQANLIARGVELVNKRLVSGLTPEENAEAAALQAKLDSIKPIRTRSDQLEAAVRACTSVEEVRDLALDWSVS